MDNLGIFVSKNGRATDGIPRVIADASDDIKTQMRRTLSGIMNVDSFTLEQVYALDDKKYMGPDGNVDIIHLGIINGTTFIKIIPRTCHFPATSNITCFIYCFLSCFVV